MDSGWMTGLDRTTGRRRWILRDRCDVKSAATTPATILISQDCGQGGEIAGYALATGAQRWARPTAGWFPGITDAQHQSPGVGTLDTGRFVVWGRKKAVLDAATGRTLAEHGDAYDPDKVFAADIEYSGCNTPRSTSLALCASDPTTGRLLWRRMLHQPRSLLVGQSSIAVADGRVYALAGLGGDYFDRIVIADAGTGALLATLPAPPAAQGTAQLDQITDGVLSLQTTDFDARDSFLAKRSDVLLTER